MATVAAVTAAIALPNARSHSGWPPSPVNGLDAHRTPTSAAANATTLTTKTMTPAIKDPTGPNSSSSSAMCASVAGREGADEGVTEKSSTQRHSGVKWADMTGEPYRGDFADEAHPFRAPDVFWFVTIAWLALLGAVLVLTNSPGTSIAPGLEGFLVTAIAVVSLLVTWATAPLAWLLGRSLRRVQPAFLHLVVFGASAFIVGLILGTLASSFAHTSSEEASIATGAVCAACGVLGRSGAFIARWATGYRTRARSAAV